MLKNLHCICVCMHITIACVNFKYGQVLKTCKDNNVQLYTESQKMSLFHLAVTLTYMNQFLANVNSRSRSLYAIARPSVVCLSVTFVRPTQAIKIFGNISTVFGTLSIR